MSSSAQRQAVGADAGALERLLAEAAPAEPGHWDELRDAGGRLRPAWQHFATCTPLPEPRDAAATELERRHAQVAQQLRRDGVTHNVFAAGGVAARPWALELLPLLIQADEWARLEAGVVQRAGLLEAMLADLLGPQRLVHEGFLPPALLMRHPGWMRPMVGAEVAGGQRLFIIAFDVARRPDGSWCLLAQRTQGPSGLGYVLHNRLVVSRQFPDAFRELRVQHIASSYRRLLASVEQRAAVVAGNGTPRVVLLTPGPYAETYFEHAYLARYLGLPLAEGGDLTVRGERLFLKTVDGLEAVHGVLRRLDDEWCDPLELRPDSALGVPGLLQAVRAGRVVVANALGSAVLETPALLGFLPAISERLLGEPLKLPALESWWCGEAAAWRAVRGRVSELVLRSTFPSDGRTSRAALEDEPSELAARIDADPDAWTAQERLLLSHAPTWGAGMVTPRPAVVRVYAVVDGAGRWHVLPGGMTRVAGPRSESISMQRGGISLDTWVQAEGPVDTYSMLPQRLTVAEIAARSRPVSSRTGENLFWLGRYTERTEQLVRLARATLALVDADSDAGEPERQALSALALAAGLVPAGTPTLVQASHLFERAVRSAIGDEAARGGACSIAYNLRALERASQALRERLSSEHAGQIRAMRESFAAALAPPGPERGEASDPGDPVPARGLVGAALDRLALHLAAVTGAQTDRMTRDHGWRLLTVGRLLERLIGISQRLATFLDAHALDSAAGVDLLLDLFDSAITFRARYQRHDDLLALADLLVMDSTNPRSFAGVLRRLRTEIGKLPGTPESLAPLSALLPERGAGLALADLDGLGDRAVAAALRAMAGSLAGAAMRLSDEVGERFFNPARGQDQRV